MDGLFEIPNDTKQARGTWWSTNGEPPRILLSCPECGLVAELDHAVDAAGVVTPSLQCPVQGCFHHMVKLGGWPGWVIPLPPDR